MKIVVIGANGQVGSEVTLLLARMPGVSVIPVSRSHSGSASLRRLGIAVRHGSISHPDDAARLLRDADVVANFALATGTPAESFAANQQIIAQTFSAAPKDAIIVFFSTLAVLGNFDERKRKQRTLYTKLKLQNEKQVLETAAQSGQRAYVLRLGNVGGLFQGISAVWRNEIKAGPVVLIDGERKSNVIFTVTIADALCAIGNSKAGPPGLYDLVNVPQWTWREIYEYEAARLDLPVTFEADPTAGTVQRPRATPSLKGAAVSAITSLGLKDLGLRMASRLPASMNDAMKAEAYVNRARAEIAQLMPAARTAQASQRWPGIEEKQLAGLARTRDILGLWDGVGTLPDATKRWPQDI